MSLRVPQQPKATLPRSLGWEVRLKLQWGFQIIHWVCVVAVLPQTGNTAPSYAANASCALWRTPAKQLAWPEAWGCGSARWAGWRLAGCAEILESAAGEVHVSFAAEIPCSWMAQEMSGLPRNLHTSEGTTDKEPSACKRCAHSHWGCSAGSLRNLVLLFLQFIPTQSKVVSFNAVEHNYRPDRLWQVGWDIYSCSRQMLKWFCIGKCCLWNVLS